MCMTCGCWTKPSKEPDHIDKPDQMPNVPVTRSPLTGRPKGK